MNLNYVKDRLEIIVSIILIAAAVTLLMLAVVSAYSSGQYLSANFFLIVFKTFCIIGIGINILKANIRQDNERVITLCNFDF